MGRTLETRQGIWQKAVRRRQVLRATALGGAGAAAALALGCSRGATRGPASGSSSNAAGTKQPKRGGVLTYAGDAAGSNDTRGRTFDPAIQTQWSDKSYLLFYDRVLGYDPRTYKVQPELAAKWEQPSPTEYVFHLQPGVKWHNKPPLNGRALTSDDLAYILKRAGSDNPRLFTRSLLTFVDRIDTPDPATLRVTTKGPDASTLAKLSSELLEVLAPEVLEKNAKLTTADAAIGTGPFIMTSVEERVAAEYQRNPDYWKKGLPYLDSFRTKAFADGLSAWAAYQAGQVDVVLVPGPEVQKYVAQQGPGYSPDWFADDTTCSILTPNTKQKPMDDARVTRALRLLIDHDEFIKAWAENQYGRGTHGSLFPTALSAWDLTEAEYRTFLEWKQPKDEAAKQAVSLLNAAGFTKDNPLRFTVILPTGSSQGVAGQLMQAQWKRWSQGIVDVQLQLLEQAAIDSIRAQRSFTYGHFGFSAGLADPDIWLTTAYYTGGSLNFASFSDPQVDAMIEKQRGIFDEQQRKATVKQIVLYMIDHGPTTFGANLEWLQLAKPKVQDFVPCNTLNGHVYQSVWLS